MNTLFIINPHSGARRRFDVAALIRETCRGWPGRFEIVSSERKEDLDEIIARAQRDGFDVAYAVGGDGTVHEIGARLIGTGLALGILPTGSGNGLARHLGIPTDGRRSLLACAAQRIETIDTAVVNGRPFLGVMGAGFDAFIAHRFHSSKVRGFGTYVQVGLRGFFEYRPETYAIEADGRRFEQCAFTITVANSSQFGNDARIAPQASVRDGVLDLVVIRDVGVFRAIPLVARLFLGSLRQSSHVTMLQARRIAVTRAAEGPAHLDGEPVMLPALLAIEVVPMSLKVVVPDTPRAI